jgi:hypothetical protein
MDDEQELLPDDLDALIDDLQKGSPITVPTSQQPAAEFLQDLVNSAHATELDPTYAARLDQRLKNNVTFIFPRGALQIWLASLHPGQPWRRLALALTSITLVSVLAISSMVSPHMQSVNLTPVLAYATLDSLAPDSLVSNSTHEVVALSATSAKIATNTTALQAVQAPEPPHTPFPTRTASSEPSIYH